VKEKDLGATKVYVVSADGHVVLVRNKNSPHPRKEYWKLPGGSIDATDEDVISAAIREVREETGILLERVELELVTEQYTGEDGKFHPYLYIARISREKMNSRHEIGDENGYEMEVGIFHGRVIATMKDLLPKHRNYVCEIEMALVA